MASEGDTAITTQPRSRRKEIEQFVRDLDPTQVVGKQRVVSISVFNRMAGASKPQLARNGVIHWI